MNKNAISVEETTEKQKPGIFFTLPQAADYLGLSERTVRRYAKADPPIIPSRKNRLGHFIFTRRSLDSFIEEQGMAHS